MAELLQYRLADLEGGEASLVLSSGIAATACTVLTLLQPGDHLLVGGWLRPESRQFFEVELPSLGMDVEFINPLEPRMWRRSVHARTRALFIESPVLATTRIVDLRPLHHLTKETGLALIVDATAATPMTSTPLAHGADLVVHDARHLLDGAGDGPLGVVTGTETVIESIRMKRDAWGLTPHPAAVSQLERGLATLEVRIARQTATAQAIAEWTQGCRGVQAVYYPGLPSHPDHAVASEQWRGSGTTLMIDCIDDERGDRLREMVPGVEEAASTDTRVAPLVERRQVALHIGLESVDAVRATLSAALE